MLRLLSKPQPLRWVVILLGNDFRKQPIYRVLAAQKHPFPRSFPLSWKTAREGVFLRVQARLAPLGPRPGMPPAAGSALLGTNFSLTARLRLNPLKKWGMLSPRNKRRWSALCWHRRRLAAGIAYPVVFAALRRTAQRYNCTRLCALNTAGGPPCRRFCSDGPGKGAST